MTEKRNFTKRFLEDLAVPKEGRTQVRDAGVVGLGLVVHASGKRVFYWYKNVRGEPTYRNVGEFPSVTLDEARAQAYAWNSAAAEWKRGGYVGSSPFAKREPTAAFTLDKLIEEYIARHLREHAKNPADAEKDLRWMMSKYLADWKSRAIGEISAEEVNAWHLLAAKKYGERTANHTVKVLRTLYRFAVRAGLWEGTVPTVRVHFYHETKRDRYLSPTELSQLLNALPTIPSADLRDFVLLALATAARRSDVLGMKWEDVSLPEKCWRVPNPKARVPYVIPLTEAALRVLKARLRVRVAEEQYVFPGVGESGHVMDLKKRWRELLIAAKLDYPDDPERRPTVHDLRRTTLSYAAARGVSLPIIARMAGHQSLAATQIYARLDTAPIRAEFDAVGAVMEKAARKRPKVVRPKLLTAVG